MPQLLHVHLRTGLDYETIDSVPDSLLPEDAFPDDHYDPDQQAAKRQRIEAIANSYLRGKRPTILSAGLRGPFDKWDNPWGKRRVGSTTGTRNNGRTTSRAQATEQVQAQSRLVAQRKGTGVRVVNRNKIYTKSMKDISRRSARESPAERHLRAGYDEHDVADGYNEQNEDAQQMDEDEILDMALISPAGEVIPEEQSGGTEYFNAPGQRTLNDSSLPLANLRLDGKSAGLVAIPTLLNADWRSDASASMVISSPPKPLLTSGSSNPGQCAQQRHSLQIFRPIELTIDLPASRNHASHTIENATLAENQQNAPRPSRSDPTRLRDNIDSAKTVRLQEADVSVLEDYRSVNKPAWQAIQSASAVVGNTGTPLSREDVLRSEARCAQDTPTPLNAEPPRRRSSRRTSKETKPPRPFNHDLVASPALASSSGFIYRKSEKTKAKERAKPHLMTFSSPPDFAKGGDKPSGRVQADPAPPEEEANKIANQITLAPVPTSRPDVYDIAVNGTAEAEGHDGEGGNGSQRSRRLSSNYSTQAALLLAQMEFQEGTFPSVSWDSPRTAPSPQDDTPQPNRRDPTPIITPFHAFNKELDKKHPLLPESAFCGPPMSTQDLFGAASPFALSTIKKKSARPQRSGLRFALSNENVEHAEDAAGSPTPPYAERVPLKDRNHKVSLRATPVNGSEKGCQDSLLLSWKLLKRDVEPPVLDSFDFRTSLDDMGPNGDVDFTDRFLQNINGMS